MRVAFRRLPPDEVGLKEQERRIPAVNDRPATAYNRLASPGKARKRAWDRRERLSLRLMI